MPRSIRFIFALWLFFSLAACAPAGPGSSGGPAATNTAPPPSPAAFSDPFAYCAAIGTIDKPDARYSGPKIPDTILQGLKTASGASADLPLEVLANGSVWRCMNGEVYACFVGANLPCESKANVDQTPTQAEVDYCKTNPESDFIPAAVTGHETIFAWACKSGVPVVEKQVFQVDPQGYIKEIWYPIPK